MHCPCPAMNGAASIVMVIQTRGCTRLIRNGPRALSGRGRHIEASARPLRSDGALRPKRRSRRVQTAPCHRGASCARARTKEIRSIIRPHGGPCRIRMQWQSMKPANASAMRSTRAAFIGAQDCLMTRGFHSVFRPVESGSSLEPTSDSQVEIQCEVPSARRLPEKAKSVPVTMVWDRVWRSWPGQARTGFCFPHGQMGGG